MEQSVLFAIEPAAALPQKHVVPFSTPKKAEPQQKSAQPSSVMLGLVCEGPVRTGC
jgi:hypothetical protein